MNFLSDFIIASGLIFMFILSLIGIMTLIEGQSKDCEVTFQHKDRVIVHIGEWK